MSRRCLFLDCRAPATNRIQRLWTIPGRPPFPATYCCDAHVPGGRPDGRQFYAVTPLTATDQECCS